MEESERVITVRHPVHGSFIAVGVRDKLEACIRAGKLWRVQWSRLARECTFFEKAEKI